MFSWIFPLLNYIETLWMIICCVVQIVNRWTVRHKRIDAFLCFPPCQRTLLPLSTDDTVEPLKSSRETGIYDVPVSQRARVARVLVLPVSLICAGSCPLLRWYYSSINPCVQPSCTHLTHIKLYHMPIFLTRFSSASQTLTFKKMPWVWAIFYRFRNYKQ